MTFLSAYQKLKRIVLCTLVLCSSAYAQSVDPFSVRFQTAAKGNIVFVSNSILQCSGLGGGGADCGELDGQLPPTFEDYSQNNDHIAEYIDIDSDPSTFSSSSDSLVLPVCSKILFAGVYWGGRSDDDDDDFVGRDSIMIDVNGDGYETVVADELIDAGALEGLGNRVYYCFADITEIVQANPITSEYTVADIYSRLQSGANRWGGWNIVVVYENAALPMRTLNVFDGLVNVDNSGTNVEVGITGFSTPPAGSVDFEVGVYGYDGDRGFIGDSLLFDGGSGFIPISNALNPLDDIFNSSQTNAGAVSTTQTPLKHNTISTDADIFRPDNSGFAYIGNSQTEADIKITTSNETVQIQVVTLAIDVYEPALEATLGVEDLNGGLLERGDTLEYTITAKNKGSNNATDVFITDTIPSILDYVPESMEITFGPNLGGKTDADGDDQATYDILTHSVRMNVGTGADNVVGGLVENSLEGTDSTIFTFRTVVRDDCVHLLCDNTVSNLATVFGTGEVSGNMLMSESIEGAEDGDGCPIIGPTELLVEIGDCILRPDTLVAEICTGGDPSIALTYDEDGYLYFDAAFDPIDELAAAGDIYAISNPFPGCADTIIITISELSENPSAADAGSDLFACEDDPSAVLAGVDPAIGVGEWSVVDGSAIVVDVLDPASEVNTLEVGENTLVWTTSNGSCPTTTDTVIVTLQELPTESDAGSDQLVCVDGTAVLEGNTPLIGEGEWSVTFGGADITDITDPTTTISSLDLGPNIFTWTISNGVCPPSSNSVTIVQDFDPDGDGVCLTDDLDNDNDGIPDINEVDDNDGDGVPDNLDLDSDNDGIPDLVEAGGVDVDGDGRIDGFTDLDLDGLDDGIDAAPLENPDSDDDGVRDVKDLDSDNDGIPDIRESRGTDIDGNGVLDDDADTDDDGYADSVDPDDNDIPGPADGTGIPLPNPDSDGDGVPNRQDLDSDNDGLSDVFEIKGIDLSMDGRIDAFSDGDDDGLADDVDPDDGGTPLPTADFDQDGIPNSIDRDSDQDGIPDVTEAGGIDANGDGKLDSFVDVDGDGFSNLVDTDNDNLPGADDGGTPLPIPNTDETGGPDHLDIDADGDGIVDNLEAQSSLTYEPSAGGDSDQDGINDAYDTDAGGTAANPIDSDGDGTPDYLDLDTDNDGEGDHIEGHDLDGDGTPESIPELSDSDNDGLDDGYDMIILIIGTTHVNAANGSIEPLTDGIYADADNPGIGDFDFREVDTDRDGVLNVFDEDDDNDGIRDVVEDQDLDGDGNPETSPTDTDEDGIIDILDLDSDNDGIPDLVEGGGVDENGDARVDDMSEEGLLLSDVNVNGLADEYDSDASGEDLPVPDTDEDSQRDFQDLDSDDDGIYDLVEANGTDEDNDGLVDDWSDGNNDGWDADQPSDGTQDSDGDGTPDFQDTDSDNDSVPDSEENDSNGDGTGPDDTDGDGVVDFRDPDDDNDGKATEEEAEKDELGNYVDCDNDGTVDYLDPDPCDLFVPSAFTPDDDGINDLFVIQGIAAYPQASLIVFNRWGDKVYESTGGYNNDWDGVNNFGQIGEAKRLPESTYYYVLNLGGETTEPIKGYVYLKR